MNPIEHEIEKISDAVIEMMELVRTQLERCKESFMNNDKDLADQIIAAWQREALDTTAVEILLSGTRNFVNFVSFRRMLSKIDGVLPGGRCDRWL